MGGSGGGSDDQGTHCDDDGTDVGGSDGADDDQGACDDDMECEQPEGEACLAARDAAVGAARARAS